jgi:hypothetical protein
MKVNFFPIRRFTKRVYSVNNYICYNLSYVEVNNGKAFYFYRGLYFLMQKATVGQIKAGNHSLPLE